MTHNVDIIIIGGGLLGMLAAIGATEQGFSVALIEKNTLDFASLSDDLPFYGQTLALNKRTQAFLQQLNVWDKIHAKRVAPYTRMQVWDQHYTGQVTFDGAQFSEDSLGVIIEQQNVLQALAKVLKEKSILCLEQTQVKEVNIAEQVTCVAEAATLTGRMCIAADGANSWVRQKLNIETQDYPYAQQALIATLQCEKSHEFMAVQRFAQSGPLAMLPLPLVHQVSLIWSVDDHDVPALLALKPDDFANKITHETESVFGKLDLLTELKAIPLAGQHAKQYYRNRCALVGDSAHRIHPLAGLGANLGVMDVIALLDVLGTAKKKRRDIGHDSVLVRYQQKRWLSNQLVLRAMNAFKSGFGAKFPAVRALRAEGLTLVDNMPILKQFFAKHAFGEGV